MADTTFQRQRVPELADGITRLASDEGLGVALQAIAVNELSETPDAPALWVDAGGAAASRGLYEQGLDPERTSSLLIARAFTAYQHATLVERLAERLSEATPFVICSNVADLYDDGDLHREEARQLLGAAMDRLEERITAHDVPAVLTTGTPEDRRLASIVEGIADRTTECRPTRLGLRFSGEGFETATYETTRSDCQTTFEYWTAVAVERAVAGRVAAERATTERWADDRIEEWVEQPLEPMGPSVPIMG